MTITNYIRAVNPNMGQTLDPGSGNFQPRFHFRKNPGKTWAGNTRRYYNQADNNQS